MKLYNSATHQVEDFEPINTSEVKIYTCGPTVYSRAHIGNLASYIYWDLLVRALKANGYTPKRVLNLTDVGHLTSDADEGDDKLEKGAKKEGKTVWEIADSYIETFFKDFYSLNLLKPEVIARATDYINQDKELVSLLIDKGYTYETSDGIYFDTSKFARYAEFANLDLDGLKAGARVDFNPEKKNPSDFAVWKFIKPTENHAMRWDFLGKPGYPGWHLECSSIIHSELGETIDIHTGGIDHVPIHHTNEIAQSESAFNKKLANFWLHCDFINIDNQKISKSLGNVYSLDDLRERGFSPLDFKMWVLEGTYQGTRNFTFEGLEAAKNRRLNWRNNIALSYQDNAPSRDLDSPDSHQTFLDNQKSKILSPVSNNLNSAEAFAYIDSQLSAPNDFWQFVDELFGLNLLSDSPDISAEQKQLIIDREAARANKNFAESDAIRARLNSTGITILDTPTGPIWQYLS